MTSIAYVEWISSPAGTSSLAELALSSQDLWEQASTPHDGSRFRGQLADQVLWWAQGGRRETSSDSFSSIVGTGLHLE